MHFILARFSLLVRLIAQQCVNELLDFSFEEKKVDKDL